MCIQTCNTKPVRACVRICISISRCGAKQRSMNCICNSDLAVLCETAIEEARQSFMKINVVQRLQRLELQSPAGVLLRGDTREIESTLMGHLCAHT